MFRVPVGGVANNAALRVKQGRYSIPASDLRARVFEPVVAEVIKMVNAQITSSKVPIKSVLLVGGFGKSNYLKERLRMALGTEIRVMQPANAWQAVVQGAVMKGLALASPETFKAVIVLSRRARNHYGHTVNVTYDAHRHVTLEHEKHWSGFYGEYRVSVMDWMIIRVHNSKRTLRYIAVHEANMTVQGSQVEENKPILREYCMLYPIEEGRPRTTKVTILTDRSDRDAPLAKDAHVKKLCNITADFSSLPNTALSIDTGNDGKGYYRLDFGIEVVCLSAATTYTLVFDGTSLEILC